VLNLSAALLGMATLPVNRGWFLLHASCAVDVEYRAATARWRRLLLTDPGPATATFVNGYRKESPRVRRRVLSVELVPTSELPERERAAHGFDGAEVIRLHLGEIVEG
jgi:hypothetical protein